MYAAGTHRVIPTDTCLLENKTAKRIILAIKQIMQHYHMEPYNEDTERDLCATLLCASAILQRNFSDGNYQRKRFSWLAQFLSGTVNASRYYYHRTEFKYPTNERYPCQEEKTLYGPGFILDKLCGLSFRISSHSFYQVNSTQTEVLYRYAIQMAQSRNGNGT